MEMNDQIDLTKEKENLEILKGKMQSLLRKPRKNSLKLSIEAVLGSLDHLIYDLEKITTVSESHITNR